MKTLLTPYMPISLAGFNGGINLYNHGIDRTSATLQVQINRGVKKTIVINLESKEAVNIDPASYGLQGIAQIIYTVSDDVQATAFTISPNGAATCTPVIELPGTVKN